MLMLMMRLKMTIIKLSNEGVCIRFRKACVCFFSFFVAEMLKTPNNCQQKLILEFPFLHQISPDHTADDDMDYKWRGTVR